MPPRRRQIEQTEVSTAAAKAQLVLLLTNMPADRLAAASVDSLAAINRSPRRFIAEKLLEAQLRRSAGG